jgi:hypothetical protein
MDEWLHFIRTFMSPDFGCSHREIADIEKLCEAIGIQPNRGWDIIRIVKEEVGKCPINTFKGLRSTFYDNERDFAIMVFGVLISGCSFKAKTPSDIIINIKPEGGGFNDGEGTLRKIESKTREGKT